MVTEVKVDVDENIHCYQNGTDEDIDFRCVVKNLYDEKLKLLKEQKTLYLLLADKEEQIIKISEAYKTKWVSVCDHLRKIEQICSVVKGSEEQLSELRIETTQLLNCTSPPQIMDSSISSYFTATDTADSTFTSSSDSLVAKNNTDTLTKFTGYQSLNSLTNDINRLKSEEDDCNHLKINDHSHRSHSDSNHDNNEFITRRSGVETDTSDSLFRIPEDNIRRSKKLTKKANIKTEKSTDKIEVKKHPIKPIANFTNPEVYNWLLNVARLPKFLVEDIKIKNKINGQNLDQVTEQKFDKLFGTSDKLIKRKVLLALEEYKSDESQDSTTIEDLSSKDHLWIANIWLKKHLGLSHLSTAFLSRCIDGRLLKFIANCNHSRMKELISMATINYESSTGVSATPISNVNKAIYEPSKSDLRSLRFGLELLVKFEFDTRELEKRRHACDDLNTDVLVWTNERFAKWFQSQNLKNYIRGIEFSGIHGAMMVLDSQFSVPTMSKLIQMPHEVVKKNNLEEKISTLLKPSRFNEGVKSRRSTSIFRRRSLSQPRFPKSKTAVTRTSNVTPEMSDSASNNDSTTLTVLACHKDKSQTIDLSHSPSRNQNFVRNYRRPDQTRPRISVTRTEPDDAAPLSPVGQHHTPKSPPAKLSTFPLQIIRKLNRKSVSGSENDEDCEI